VVSNFRLSFTRDYRSCTCTYLRGCGMGILGSGWEFRFLDVDIII